MKTEKSYLNRISSSILILLLISLGIFSTGKLNATSPGIPGITIAAPTALDATEVTLNSFKANWSSDPNDEYYQLYVYRFVGYVLESIPVWEVLPSYNGITVQPNYQTIQGLSQNTRYKYLVYAYDIQDNKSLKSNEMEVVTHGAAPVAKAATSITTVSFTANWNASSGAVSYMLTVNDITSGSTKFSNRIVSGLSYSVTGLNPNNAYSYDVKANFDVVVSVPSNLITVNTLPTPPIATTASTINTTSFNANWNAVAGATGYKLWVYSNVSTGYSPAGYFPKTIGNFTSYTISGLTSGHSYSYFVQVITSLGISTASNTIEVTTKPIAPAAMDASDITFNSFVANWQTVVGATGYKISVWTEVGSYPVVGYEGKAVTGNSTTVTGLSPETGYYYRIRAVVGDVQSDWSEAIFVTTSALAPPLATVATDITAVSFTANWNAVAGATGYEIDVSVKIGKFWYYLANYKAKAISGKNEVVTGLSANTTYMYEVRAIYNTHKSVNSNQIQVTTSTLAPPAAPVATAATVITSGSFTANWQTVVGATGYKISVWTEVGSYPVVGYEGKAVTGNSTTVTGLSPETGYYYRIRAVVGDVQSDWSEAIFVTTTIGTKPAPTEAMKGPYSFDRITAAWLKVSNATGYKLFFWRASDHQFVDGYNGKTISGTSEIVSGLEPETAYQFWVVVLAGDQESVASNIVDNSTTADPSQTYTLTLSASPAGAGTVSGGGTFSSGSSLTAIATAATGYNFANWTDESGAVVSTAASYAFNITANRTLVANFVQQVTNYTLSLSANPTLGGTVSGGGTFSSGTSLTAIATPATGYDFANWTEGDAVVSTAASYAFNITANCTLVANFVQQLSTYTLSLSANPSVGGTVSGGGTFSSGTSHTAIATAATGYNFVNWTDESGAVVSTAASYTFNITVNRTLVANFVQQVTSVTLSLSANPSVGGIVNGGGTFENGTSVTAAASKATGYKFVNWTENGTEVSTSANYTFTISANRTLVANFEKLQADKFTVTLNVEGVGGTINFETKTVEQGSEVTIIATPNTAYKFVNWTVGAIEISKNAEYTFAVTENITLTAHFEKETALVENALQNLKVYPNPVSDFLNISGVPLKSVLTMVTLSGSKVQQVEVNNPVETIDTQDMPKGVYFLIVETHQSRITRKVILQ